MRKIKFYKAINIAVFTLFLAIYLALFIQTLFVYKNQTLNVIIFSASGIVIMLILTILFHELGHYLFGKFSGLEFHSINVLFFGFYKDATSDKKKVSFSLKNKNFGDTVMTVKNNEKVAKKVGIFALGGLVFNLIVMCFGVIMLFTTKSLILYCLFGISFVVPSYVLIINLLPISPLNDGSVATTLLFGGVDGKTAENYFICSNYLMQGVTPHSIPELYKHIIKENSDYYTVSIKYLRYLSSLILDENTAINELNSIDLNTVIEGGLYNRLITEKFFISIIKNDEKEIEFYKDLALDVLTLDDTPTGYRILATYYCYLGDFERAELLTKSGLNSCDGYYPQGISESERKYFEFLEVALKK